MDLVGTCPMKEWEEWIAEGDAAGTPETGVEYSWYTRDRQAAKMSPGDRFYVVAHGRLRGYAPVVEVETWYDGKSFAIVRKGNAVACTIDAPCPGFRGLRRPWWRREDEKPFTDWRAVG